MRSGGDGQAESDVMTSWWEVQHAAAWKHQGPYSCLQYAHSFLFYLYNNLICVDNLDLKWLPNCYLCSQEPWQTSFKLTVQKCSQLKEGRCVSLPAKHPWQAFLRTILICFHLIKEHFPVLWLLSLPEVVPIIEMNKYFSPLVSTCLVICYTIRDL